LTSEIKILPIFLKHSLIFKSIIRKASVFVQVRRFVGHFVCQAFKISTVKLTIKSHLNVNLLNKQTREAMKIQELLKEAWEL